MLFFKISRPNLNEFYIEKVENMLDAMDAELTSMYECFDLDDKICIELIEMTQEQFDELDEFSGW